MATISKTQNFLKTLEPGARDTARTLLRLVSDLTGVRGNTKLDRGVLKARLDRLAASGLIDVQVRFVVDALDSADYTSRLKAQESLALRDLTAYQYLALIATLYAATNRTRSQVMDWFRVHGETVSQGTRWHLPEVYGRA